MSTVRATREADVDALVAASLPRVEAMLREGVTTLEIKSGYGLELESEARMLQAAPATPLVETRRAQKVKTLSAWQRMILFEQQIL